MPLAPTLRRALIASLLPCFCFPAAAQSAGSASAPGESRAEAADLARFFPLSSPLAENPYAQAAIAQVPRILSRQIDAADESEARRILPRFSDPRDFSHLTQVLVWAYLEPSSPHHRDPALLDQIVRRMELLTHAVRGGSYFPVYAPMADNHYNVFFFESFGFSCLALKTLAPQAVAAGTMSRWETIVREGLKFQAGDPAGHEHNGEYGIIPNIDLRYMNMLEIGARLFHDEPMHLKAERLLAVTERHLLPDGAFHYYGGENECFSYHESDLRDLARYHFLTGSPLAAAMIARTRGYYPLAVEPGGVAEYYSAPSWKAFWNGSGTAVGPRIAAWFSGDPVNQGIANEQLRLSPGLSGAYQADLLIAMGCHDPKAPAAAQPDDTLLPDANIGGFRGRFGRFAFMGDARDRRATFGPIQTSKKERDPAGAHLGRSTYVGALVTDGPTRPQALNAALLGAGSSVRFKKTDPAWLGDARLSNDSAESLSFSPERAGLSARYGLGSGAAGPRYVPRPGWIGREAWFFARDHVVGYVSVEASEDAVVSEVAGRISLGYGRAGPGLIPKSIQKTAANEYAYGDLCVRIARTNYGASRVDENAPYFRNEAPRAAEIRLHDPAGPDTESRRVPAGTRRFYVVEIRPAWAAPYRDLAFAEPRPGLVELTVEDGRTRLIANMSDEAQPVALGTDERRMISLSSPRPPPASEPQTGPANIMLPPTHHVIVLR